MSQRGNVDMTSLESVARHVIYCRGRKQQEAFLAFCERRWKFTREAILAEVSRIRKEEKGNGVS